MPKNDNTSNPNKISGLLDKLISQIKYLPPKDKFFGFGISALLIFCLIFRGTISSLPPTQFLMIPSGIILIILARIIFGNIKTEPNQSQPFVPTQTQIGG